MRRSLDVLLHGSIAGRLTQRNDGRWSFAFDANYREAWDRPVLGQWFEDDLDRDYVTRHPGRLPSFFANLVPETGELRTLLERRFAIERADDAALLVALGSDLPGAVTVRGDDSVADETHRADGDGGADDDRDAVGGFRFSLAGVQLKFSMIRDARGLTVPASGERGKWIVKFGGDRFPALADNEFTVMSWARAAGFDIPEIALVEPEEIRGIPADLVRPLGRAFAIRRYDRGDGGPIHQEVFAQVMNVRPGDAKYESAYEKIGKLVRVVCGEDGYDEFVRRLVLMLAAGNDDAHLKNWSLVYPDRIRAELSPLYDQVCIAQYRVDHPQLDRQLALRFANLTHAAEVDTTAFERLARPAGADPERTVEVARVTARDLAATWPADSLLAPAIRKHWGSVHFLRESATLGP